MKRSLGISKVSDWGSQQNGLHGLARKTFAELLEQLHAIDMRVAHYDRRIAGTDRPIPILKPPRYVLPLEGKEWFRAMRDAFHA